jgi:hypothetical protein
MAFPSENYIYNIMMFRDGNLTLKAHFSPLFIPKIVAHTVTFLDS